MPKDSRSRRSATSSRALRRLEPYNDSPGGRQSRSRSGNESTTEAAREREQQVAVEEPPAWAKELLQQQKQYAKELKKMKSDLDAAKRAKQDKPSEPEPEFKFEGNRKQYQLNRKVLDKISAARSASDDEERDNLLQEGESLLIERNKHICLGDKYGWDTVDCYTSEPLACDSGDEKRIKKAIKESKQLREEKRKATAAKWKAKKFPQRDEKPRRVVLAGKASSHFSAGKSQANGSRDSQQVCFRCFRSGHFARDCRASIANKGSDWARSVAQSSGSQQQ